MSESIYSSYSFLIAWVKLFLKKLYKFKFKIRINNKIKLTFPFCLNCNQNNKNHILHILVLGMNPYDKEKQFDKITKDNGSLVFYILIFIYLFIYFL